MKNSGSAGHPGWTRRGHRSVSENGAGSEEKEEEGRWWMNQERRRRNTQHLGGRRKRRRRREGPTTKPLALDFRLRLSKDLSSCVCVCVKERERGGGNSVGFGEKSILRKFPLLPSLRRRT